MHFIYMYLSIESEMLYWSLAAEVITCKKRKLHKKLDEHTICEMQVKIIFADASWTPRTKQQSV